MTPAVELLRARGVAHALHEYEHDPAAPSYGLEAAEKIGMHPDRVFKTLVVRLDHRRLAVAVVPVSGPLNLKRMAKACAARKAAMAATEDVQRATGYVPGGVSPLGQKRPLPTVIDATAAGYETVCVSGGRRGLDVELSPGDLRDLLDAEFADIRG
ncbi:MAG: Cys-tRNA(Pro) deacylase [Xanthomonadales bacterium]